MQLANVPQEPSAERGRTYPATAAISAGCRAAMADYVEGIAATRAVINRQFASLSWSSGTSGVHAAGRNLEPSGSAPTTSPAARKTIGETSGGSERSIALLLASLPSALRLFRDRFCRDGGLQTSQRSGSQQGVQSVDGCGCLHWLLGHVSSDGVDGTLLGASRSQPSLSSALASVRRTCGISLQVPMRAILSMDAASRQ